MKIASSSSGSTFFYSLLFAYFAFVEFACGEETFDENLWIAEHAYNGSLEVWMTELPVSLRERPITHLAIPGSHDSVSYTIGTFSALSPDGSKPFRLLSTNFWYAALPIVNNWSVTQNADIRQQLDNGIRYFDMRMGTGIFSTHIYFVHNQYGAESTEFLQTIAKWLDSHPSEIVIIDFQHLYEFDDDDHRLLIGQIRYIFGDKLCPEGDLGIMNLNWFVKNKYQVIAIYGNSKFSQSEDLLWPRYLWPSNWPETVEPEIMKKRLDSGLEARATDIGLISQCVLTPDMDFIKNNLLSSVKKITESNVGNVLRWIGQQSIFPIGINVVITDFVDFANHLFAKLVVQRNYDFLPELQ